jgi:ribosomal protein S18 acetylase RimI-like enzyme
VVILFIRKKRPETKNGSIHRLIKKEIFPHTKNEFPDVTYKLIETELRLLSGTTYVMTKGKINRPLGFITIFFDQDHRLVIDLLAVNRVYQSEGLGSKLMDHVEQLARNRGCTESRLMVEQGNINAQRFYLKKGYSIIEYIPKKRSFLLGKTLY